MQQRNKLRQALLAVSLAALAVPPLVQAQSSPPASARPGSGGPAGSMEIPHSSPSPGTDPREGMPEQGSTGTGDSGTTEADRALNQRIWQTLHAEPTLGATAALVQLHTANGEVTLQGTVATEREKADIAAKVQKVEGVKKVNNQLQMAPRPGGTPGGSGSGAVAPSGSTGASAGGDGMGATRSPVGK
jgi:hypothetical protein